MPRPKLIAVDTAYADVAKSVARATGWRASDVYCWLTSTGPRSIGAQAVDETLALVVEHRLRGESFKEAAERLTRVVDEIEVEHGRSR